MTLEGSLSTLSFQMATKPSPDPYLHNLTPLITSQVTPRDKPLVDMISSGASFWLK